MARASVTCAGGDGVGGGDGTKEERKFVGGGRQLVRAYMKICQSCDFHSTAYCVPVTPPRTTTPIQTHLGSPTEAVYVGLRQPVLQPHGLVGGNLIHARECPGFSRV